MVATILGLPVQTFLLFICWQFGTLAVGVILMIRGRYEGQRIEEKYETDDFYRTF